MAPLFPQVGMASSVVNPLNNLYRGNQPSPSMSINFPTMLQQQNSAPEPILVGVHGLDSVKQFPFKPNQTLSFHDLDADFEYVVNTDVNSQPAFKILKFNTISEEEYREEYSKIVNGGTVTISSEEYDSLLKRIEKLEKEIDLNAKQPVRNTKSANNISASGSNSNSTAKSSNRSTDERYDSEIKSEF